MMNDAPIRLKKVGQKVTITLDQDQLDGLCGLIHFLKGMEVAGKGEAPGSFELTMFYRSLKQEVLYGKNQNEL